MPFANKAAFLEPRRVVEPLAWAGHIPFAFWLTEALRPSCVVELGTHTGNSFCAFAQAMEAFNIHGRVHAVDHWLGDEHAGPYSDQVFEELSNYVGAFYPDIAVMLRSSFDEALDRFEDKSVDVLHIDGLHTYEAVRDDFVSWMPKVKDNGIVLLHDTAVTAHEFGVGQLLQELALEYRTCSFSHSHGLGVVALGDVPEQLKGLFDGTADATGLEASVVFERLGNGISARAHAEGYATVFDTHNQTLALAELRARIDLLTSAAQRQAALTGSFLSPYSNTGRGKELLVNQVLSSGYFSPKYYRSQIGTSEGADRELCLDYLLRGESEGYTPSLSFDPSYYAAANPDVTASTYGLLEHFILLGRHEGRQPKALASG